jgi:hypothetical protein
MDMRKRDLKTGLLICLFVHFFTIRSSAIERVTATGAKEAALAQAVVAQPGFFSVFHNQAFLTENKVPSLAVCYRQPYFIKGYHESALSIVYPIHAAVLAIGLAQSAIASYKETSLGISIAKILTRKLSAGVLFNYTFLNLPEVNRYIGSYQVDGGLAFKYSDKLSLGLHFRNFLRTNAETFQYNFSCPLEVRSGASYKLTENILLAGESTWEKKSGYGIRLGSECRVASNLCLRGGLVTKPFQHTFGFGYSWNFCQLDFAMVHHEILGYSPLLSVNFNFNK